MFLALALKLIIRNILWEDEMMHKKNIAENEKQVSKISKHSWRGKLLLMHRQAKLIMKQKNVYRKFWFAQY